MFESFMHFLGLCPDHMSHINLINILTFGMGGILIGWGQRLYYKVKSLFKRK